MHNTVKRAVVGTLGVAMTALTVAAVASAATPEATANAPAATYLDSTVPTDIGDAHATFYNGEDATLDEDPSVIGGLREGGPRPQGQTCTGSVVAPRKIVIAAHCKDAAGAKSFLYGLDDLNAPGGFRTEVVDYKQHPKYVNFDQGYDVAVVTVADDIPVRGGHYAQVATSADAALTEPGRTGVGFGYGKKDFNDDLRDVTLDKASLPIVDGDRDCQGVGAGFKSEYMVCAGYADGHVTILPGDSGGPLIVDGKVVGLASWSRSDFQWYSVYSRLTNEMGDWVHEQVGDTPPPSSSFQLGSSPSSVSVSAGEYVSTTVTSTAGTNGPESVTLSASGLPAGARATFQPSSLSTGGTAKVTFETSASTPDGTYHVTVTGANSAGKTATTVVSLTVTGGSEPPAGDFTLGASPDAVKVSAGKYVSTTVTSQGPRGSTASLSLTASGLPSGAEATFQPASIVVNGTAKVTFETSAGTPAGSYPVTVTGTAADGSSATAKITLTVEGDTPPAGGVTLTPSSDSVQQGMLASTVVTARGGTGSLRISASGVPAGTQVFYNPDTVGQGGSSNVWFFTSFQTPPGDYSVVIKAVSDDGVVGMATFRLSVVAFGAGW